MNVKSIFFCIVFAMASASICESQFVGSTVLTGTPAFQSYDGGPDTINVGNLNINWNFPIINKPGRGTPFTFNITYDSSLWSPIAVSGAKVWSPQDQFGWTTVGTGYYTYSVTYGSPTCTSLGVQTLIVDGNAYYSNFIYYDASGTAHYFSISTDYLWACPPGGGQTGGVSSATGTSSDGYKIAASGNNATITTPKGQVMTFPWLQYYAVPAAPASSEINANGNTFTNSDDVFTDTLGTTALTVSGGMNNPPLTMAFA